MTSAKAVQRETTVYAYHRRSQGEGPGGPGPPQLKFH